MNLFKFFLKGVSISLLVKLSGLFRDGLTFYFIGINKLFDSYVYYLTFPALITAFVLPLINLWLVPMLSKKEEVKEESYIKFFFVLSLVFALFNLILSFSIAYLFKGIDSTTLSLIFTATLVLIFTICSEVLASKIISQGKFLYKMYFGNLFVNTPVILYFLLPNPTVVGLAVVSSFSFVARFIYLFMYSDVSLMSVFKSSDMQKVLEQVKGIEFIELKKMLLGPLFQSAIYFGRFFCGFLPTGSASIYFYSFKLFEAFKGTLLFVGLTKFFSVIQKVKLDRALHSFTQFSVINVCVTVVYILLLGSLSLLFSYFDSQQELILELKKIVDLSYVTVPLCFLYPSLVFYQRLVVSFKEMEFNFWIFMSLPLTVFTVVGSLYLTEMLSVNYIIMAISLALIIPNLYIFNVVLKRQKFLRCKNVL